MCVAGPGVFVTILPSSKEASHEEEDNHETHSRSTSSGFPQGLSRNRAGQALGIGETTIKELVQRFQSSRMPLEEAMSMSDEELQGHLFPATSARF